MEPIVRMSGVSHCFAQGELTVAALSDVSLEIAAGQIVAVVGPSGSGKTTLLHSMGGLLTPTAGRVDVCGHTMSSAGEAERARLRRRLVGVVFQAFNLLPALTVLENVALPLMLDGHPLAVAEGRALETIDAVGLGHRRRHLPDQLSGGEGQRVAIARALVIRPALILADEPTGNLDSATGATVLHLLEMAQREHGTTVVIVTHDARGAMHATRVVRLADGRVVADGSEAAA